MLCAKLKSNGQSVIADSAVRADGPFLCPECAGEVVLRTGSVRMNHFSHRIPDSCRFGGGENDAHRKCKMAIYQALLQEPNARKVALERRLRRARPDISSYINDVPVAIEVQISTLGMDAIIRRTAEYANLGIYVLWLLQWSPYLDSARYTPRLFEKWIHAAYFWRVYYWIKGLKD